MSFYGDRWLKYAPEGTVGTYASGASLVANYILSYDLGVTENKIEEAIIAGSRDQKSRVWTTEEVTGRITYQPVGFWWLGKYGMGSNSAASVNGTFTAQTGSTLPSFSLTRCISPASNLMGEGSGTISLGLMGCKVDNWSLTLEAGEDVTCEVNFVAYGATHNPTAVAAPSVSYTLNPFGFYEGSVTYAGSVLTYIRRAVIEVNHNLEARWSAGAQSYKAQSVREGPIEISGRLTVDAPFSTFATDAIARSGVDKTINLNLVRSGYGTVLIRINNVAFGELPDTATGLDVISWELPFTARASSGYDAIILGSSLNVAIEG